MDHHKDTESQPKYSAYPQLQARSDSTESRASLYREMQDKLKNLEQITLDKLTPQQKKHLAAITILALCLIAYGLGTIGRNQTDIKSCTGFCTTGLANNIVAQGTCPTIHLASICGGYHSAREFYILLKSILFHRRSYKIHYHLFVDNISSKILKKLIETWPLQDLDITFHNATHYEKDVSWIPNSHYSNRYGLLKLLVPSILADAGIDKAILLDTDLLVLGDLKNAWDMFSLLSGSDSFLGLVENQSDWYLKSRQPDTSRIVWPAIGRGFNTGLILMDLKKAKENAWDQLWRDAAYSELVSLLSTSLADQDVYNAVIKKHQQIVFRLPCNLNLQLNNHTNTEDVCGNYRQRNLNIAHWNTQQKMSTDNNQAAEYFNDRYLTFMDWDGKLVQRGGCPEPVTSSYRFSFDWSFDPCKDIHPKLSDPLRTLLFYRDFELSDASLDEDITAVLHLTLDRFEALEDLAARWSGPLSVSIYLSEASISDLVDLIKDSSSLSRRLDIGYHLVFKVRGWHYPINRMRNIALDNVLTPYVFISDIDFLPSKDMHSYLKRTIADLRRYNRNPLDKKALVVPAFESSSYKFDFPETKDDLLDQIRSGKIKPFRGDIWPKGQANTDYNRWKLAKESYAVEWGADYEPFIVTSREVTRFDGSFVGFGWNKVEHDATLAAEGYQFLVLSEAFIIHQNHPASRDLKYFRLNDKFHRCINDLKYKTYKSLEERYPSFRGTSF